MAGILSLLIALLIGKRIIRWLQRQQIGEEIRDLGLEGQLQKKGTPTMGGIIILLAIIIPTLLLAKIDNVYVILMLVSTAWMGTIGAIDDYIKVFKKNKEGMKATTKLIGQLLLGVVIAVVIDYTHSSANIPLETNLPITSHRLDYSGLIPGENNAWFIFLPVIVFICMAVTNAVNLTDGIDGLAAGTTAIVGLGLGVLAYAAGNVKLAEYLNIIYVPQSGEVVVFLAAVAIIIKMELLIPILCGVFFAESLSVVLQVGWFKYTKKKYGEGRRIFLMSPLHHHFQKLNIPESKITLRFWLVTIILVLVSIALLKLR